MGLFSRAKKSRAGGGAEAERARAEEAFADIMLLLDDLSVDERAPYMSHAERLQTEIRRAAGEAGAHNKLVQIESELRTLERRIKRAIG